MIFVSILTLGSLLPQGPERFPTQPEQDARRYDIALNIDLAEQRLTGHVDYTFTALAELPSIRLDAQRSDDWQVTFQDLQGQPLASTWGEQHVVITLPQPAAKGSDIRFRANLRGTPVDGFYFKKNRYGDLMAFTDHYSIRARGWLPCEDNPADRAVFSVVMHYPAGNEAVGNSRFKVRPGRPEPNHPTLPPLHPAVNPRANKPPMQAFRPNSRPLARPLPHKGHLALVAAQVIASPESPRIDDGIENPVPLVARAVGLSRRDVGVSRRLRDAIPVHW